MRNTYDLGSAAISGGLGIIQSGINYGIAKWNNEEAAKREARARLENYMYNERAAENADIRTRSLYNDLYSVNAQMEQIKKAGLSPSLFYGDAGGISGQSGAMGAGASGVNPQTFGISPIDLSQIRLNNAEASKLEEEAQTTKEMREPQIAKTLAEAGHENAATAATKAQTTGIELDNYVKEHTKDANVFKICELAEKASYETVKMYNEMRYAKVLADLNEETYNTNVTKAKEELNAITESILNTKSDTKLKDQQKIYFNDLVLKNIEETAQGWKALDIKEREQLSYTEWLEARIPQIEKELDIKLKELGVQKTRIIVDAITESIRTVCTVAVLTASYKGGQGSQQMPPKPTTNTPKGNAVQKTPHVYETYTLWDY